MPQTFIRDGNRKAIGRYHGGPAGIRTDDLAVVRGLEKAQGKYAPATMCIGVGQAFHWSWYGYGRTRGQTAHRRCHGKFRPEIDAMPRRVHFCPKRNS